MASFLSILAERDREVGKLGHPRSLTINCNFLTSTTIQTQKSPLRTPIPISYLLIWSRGRGSRCRSTARAEELSDGLADPLHMRLRHADKTRQRQALPRIPVCDWEALGISYKAGQRRLGVQRHRIMQAGCDSRSPHIVAQPVAVLAAHDVEMEHMVVVHDLR